MTVWHKANEEKPKVNLKYPYESVDVLIVCHGMLYIAYYSYKCDRWFIPNTGYVAYSVTHWTELPELPKMEEK